MSTAVYGGSAIVIGTSLGRPARAALISSAVVLIIAMSLSRIVLHVHSLAEVLVGLAVGLASVTIIAATTSFNGREQLPVFWLAAVTISVATLFHGERWPAERVIHDLSGWLEVLQSWCY